MHIFPSPARGRVVVSRLVLLISSFVSSVCVACSEPSNPLRCDEGQCESGFICYRDFCIPDSDADLPDDMDAALGPDAAEIDGSGGPADSGPSDAEAVADAENSADGGTAVPSDAQIDSATSPARDARVPLADGCVAIENECTVEGTFGVCASGVTRQCGDSSECLPTRREGNERCNGLDDDCDGNSDEDFDFVTDLTHCGGCGRTCASGFTCCMGECQNLARDPLHCGQCGSACEPGEACCGETGCADLLTNTLNCGFCGTACLAGQLCCAGRCVDPDDDVNHCGTCGNTCSPSAGNETACCENGMCGQCSCSETCGVDETCCGAECVASRTDEFNCGSCGNVCALGEHCSAGTCVADSPAACGPDAVVCDSQRELCCEAACIEFSNSSCEACGQECEPGTNCCGVTGCVDLRVHSSHCGACGNACDAGEACTSGNCCPTGQLWCGGGCVDIHTDGDNCGECGRGCEPLTGCVDGDCALLGIL